MTIASRFAALNEASTEQAAADLAEGRADAISFGLKFIANPDLPERLRLGAPLNEVNRDTLYAGGAEGYVDYPALDAAKAA